MPQLRRGVLARRIVRIAGWVLTVQDRLSLADPGRLRLTLALRGTLSVFLTTLAAVLAAGATHVAVAEFAAGVTLSLMAPFLMREPTQAARQRTLLVLALPAAAATLATGMLHGRGPAGDASFLALVLFAFLFHPRNPRMIGVGLVAVITTYVGLFFELPPSTLPVQLLSILAALPIIAFACFVAVPMNAPATLRRTIASVQGLVAQVLRDARRIGESGEQDGATHTLLRRDLARLNAATLAADDQLALLQPSGREAVRSGLIDLELATARAIAALRGGARGSRHASRLLLHAERMNRGHRYVMTPGEAERGTLRGALVDLGHAVHALGVAAQQIAPAGPDSLPAARPPPGKLAWRLATRVTLAAALAMAGGMALSPQRWFWAVITVYVVFLNARSRGDTIYRGLQRLAGTLLGIVGGLLLADVLIGHLWLQISALLLSVFGMFYFILVSYTAGILCVTVMLGLLYGMLGSSPESLLLLRLEETSIGAAAAMFVAAFVLPIRTRDQVLQSGRTVLVALVAAVRASRDALMGHSAAAPMIAMRQVDRQVADLRLAMVPLSAGRALLRRSALQRPVPALLDCVHWARVLAAASPQAADGPDAAALAERAATIEVRLAALATGAQQISAEPMTSIVVSDTPRPAGEAGRALEQLDGALAVLTERLEIGALEGFSLDG